MKLLISCIVSACAFAMAASADTLFVAPDAKVGGMGTSWSDPMLFRVAFETAVSGDEIWMAKGVYRVEQTPIAYTNGVRVYGGFSAIEKARELRDWLRERTIFEAIELNVIMTMENCDSSSRIDGVHFRNATESALRINGGAPRLFNNHFRNNGVGTVRGGAIRAQGVSRLRIEYCVFEGNRAMESGGAIYITESTTDAKGFGPFIGQSFFVGNQAQQGGALCVERCAGTPQVVSSVFASNEAAQTGGAVASLETYLYVNNCTFSRNEVGSGGGAGGRAMALQGGYIQNTIIWNGVEDTAAHVRKLSPSGDTMKITASANLIENDTELGFWQFDPLFENPDVPTGWDGYFGTDDDGLRPGSNSVARDGGFIDKFVNHRQQDILGNPRLVGRKIDLGAYESQRAGRVPHLELMDEMRQGKLVFMFRHAKTDWDQRDPGPSPECFPGRNLITEGREQSVSIGAHQRALGVPQGEALSSPACRCWETLDLMVGRHEKASQWASGGSPQAVTNRLNDLKTPPTSGNRIVSTHDAVAVFVFNRDGGGETLTTAELMEGDCLVVRPLGDTMEVLSHWCSDTWERWWLKYNPVALSVQETPRSTERVAVYPNPASNTFTIDRGSAEYVVDVAVVDVMGRRMWQGTMGDVISVDLSGWTPGVYAVVAGSGRAMVVVR